MTKPSGAITELSAPAALQQCVKATRKLIAEFEKLQQGDPEQETDTLEKISAIREQLVFQAFNASWTEEQVSQYRQDLEQLESLDQELRDLSQKVRDDLHAKRSANQHNRKAVNAYGTAKSQFYR